MSPDLKEVFVPLVTFLFHLFVMAPWAPLYLCGWHPHRMFGADREETQLAMFVMAIASSGFWYFAAKLFRRYRRRRAARAARTSGSPTPSSSLQPQRSVP